MITLLPNKLSILNSSNDEIVINFNFDTYETVFNKLKNSIMSFNAPESSKRYRRNGLICLNDDIVKDTTKIKEEDKTTIYDCAEVIFTFDPLDHSITECRVEVPNCI